MKGWKAWVRIPGISIIVFLLVFSLGTTCFFPVKTVRLWFNSLDMPGRIFVSSVDFDPLLRLSLQGITWRPGKNPVVDSVVLKKIVLRPFWREVFKGHKTLFVSTHLARSPVSGTLRFEKGTIQMSVTTLKDLNFPVPFRFHKGISLNGTCSLKVDLSIDTTKERGNVLGSALLEAKKLSFRWSDSPLGFLNLSFSSGVIRGSIDRSVFDIRKIAFKGSDMNVEGNATMWIDPLTGEARLKGVLFFQPRMSLANTNPKLDAAIRFLPKESRGYKLTF